MQNLTNSIFADEGNIDLSFPFAGELKKRPKLQWEVGAITKEDEESSAVISNNSSVDWEKTSKSANKTLKLI